MRRTLQFTLFALTLFLSSCNQSTEVETTSEEMDSLSEEEYTLTKEENEHILHLGDSISNIAQSTLMQNVAMAMKEGGPVHAVDFCNLRAMPLTDSISKMHNVTIQRVTDKTRNPSNGLKTEADQLAWESSLNAYNSLDPESPGPTHFVQNENNTSVYYKPIKIGMETCLKCHGEPGKQIDKLTEMMLNEKYPEDEAINYQLNDLRGMWKISFKEKD